MSLGIDLAERGLLPDWAIRYGIRQLCAGTVRKAKTADPETLAREMNDLVTSFAGGPIAIETKAANDQHYEVPPAFFTRVLGPRRKYSSCYYESPTATLADAEVAMLERYVRDGELSDGQRILELGCGWGSLSLFLAERFPNATIVGVSNSAPQREFIMGEAAACGLKNLTIVTADANVFSPDGMFDRVVSIEMFEHMRNHRALLERIGGWLNVGGKLFVHVFVHRSLAYPFETAGEENWMGRHFFTGGMMPSDDWLLRFQDHLTVEWHGHASGTHYERTSNHWLDNLDSRRDELLPILRATHGTDANRMFHRWRIFFLACAELFGYDRGREWFVAHYRFRRR